MKKSGRPKKPEPSRKYKPGFYRHFPEISHKLVSFVASVSIRKLQQALVNMLTEANAKTFNLESLTDPSVENCKVAFEFGVATGEEFEFLNKEENQRIQQAIRTEPLQVIDILCAVRYHRILKEKKIPLRFDYYMVRFRFDQYRVIQVFHERGPGHLAPKDIINFLVTELNRSSPKKLVRIETAHED